MTKTCTVWILGDQLLARHPAITAAEEQYGKDAVHIVLVESQARLARRPYHRKKLILVLSAMRHYAKELEVAGYQVNYLRGKTVLDELQKHVDKRKPEKIFTMAASEYQGRIFQKKQLSRRLGVPVEVIPNTQFLTGRFNPIPEPENGKRYVMEYFYRSMRQHFDLLMEGDSPTGGAWNFDKENRKPLPKEMDMPPLPDFPPDEITRQVILDIEGIPEVFGEGGAFNLAVTREGAERALNDFLQRRLPNFGAYEDAMSREHDYLFHSMLSSYLNLGLLDPLGVARQAEAQYQLGRAPINSVEGFIRQVIGWREYIYWQYWRSMPGYVENNFWNARRPLPEMFWHGKTDMVCLQTVFSRIQQSGYVHHIERLMLLSNFSLLMGLDPAAVNEWFLSSFVDAYEWVMAPNVIGMGLHADGGLTATKPYIASANYINKMSNYCKDCRFDRKQRTGVDACPFNTLYWYFLIENEDVLRGNPRMGRNVLGLRYLDDESRERVRKAALDFFSFVYKDCGNC